MAIKKMPCLLTAVALVCSCTCTVETDSSFVSVKDGVFICEGKEYNYIGTNFWYGAILGSQGEGGDRERLKSELDVLKSLGMDNLRILVGGDGEEVADFRISPALQKAPGVYDVNLLSGLDYLLDEMGKRQMKAVLYLTNSWEWSGGYGMYLQWAGEGKAPIPAEIGYRPYTEKVSRFITNDKAKAMFAGHVKAIVSRTNSINGRPYSEDPAIFAWQVCNEPRCFSSDTLVQAAFVDWLCGTAALIKSLDSNHLVSTGSEGRFGCEGDMELFRKIHECPDIDYLTIHIWPSNWGWATKETVAEDLENSIMRTGDYIDEHMKIAGNLSKPLVLEEFGYPRDGFMFAKGSPVVARDMYMDYVLGRIVSSVESGDVLAGANFWGWGGLASQSSENEYWRPGDDYCGDPAQEPQGLFSVYASDTSTISVLRKHIERLKSCRE